MVALRSMSSSKVVEALEARRLMKGGDAPEWIFGTSGDDHMVITREGDWLVVYENGARTFGRYPTDTVQFVVHLYEGADTFIVDESVGYVRFSIAGGPGPDDLRGGPDADTFYGEPGNDVFDGGGGGDVFFGGDDEDTVTYAKRSTGVNVTLDGVANDGAPGEGDNAADSIENVVGGRGDDVLTGNAANNFLDGRAGHDRLYGRGGDDELYGGAGNDRLFGEDGIDAMYGATGDDLIYAQDGAFWEIVDGGDGTDTAVIDFYDIGGEFYLTDYVYGVEGLYT